jgi:hypothetical protein
MNTPQQGLESPNKNPGLQVGTNADEGHGFSRAT